MFPNLKNYNSEIQTIISWLLFLDFYFRFYFKFSFVFNDLFQQDGRYQWQTCSRFATVTIGYTGWTLRRSNWQRRQRHLPCARRISFSITPCTGQRTNGAITAWPWATQTRGKSPPGSRPYEITSWASSSCSLSSSSSSSSSWFSLIVGSSLIQF